jgi:hypothetical protein
VHRLLARDYLPKLASIILLAMIMVSGSAFVAILPFGVAQTSQTVNGIITQDTTWTKTNSPYTLTGPVLVDSGVTLTIDGGVTVNLGFYYIRVNGTLVIQPDATINMATTDKAIQVNGILSAVGTNDNPIHINGVFDGRTLDTLYSAIYFSQKSNTDLNNQTNADSIFENVVFKNTYVEAKSEIRFINNTLLKGGLLLSGGSSIVSNNNLATASVGIDEGSPLISNNTITGNLNFGGGHNVVIADNVIYGLTLDDVRSPYNGSLVIERNLICNSRIGVTFYHRSDGNQVIFQNNTISNNTVGIQMSLPGAAYAPAIVNNNVYDNFLNVDLFSPVSINLTNNWWGTTDQQAINQSIYDFKNDFNLGTVNFVPFSTSPNSQALPNPNAPILTPNPSANPTSTVPEFPMFIALAIIIIFSTIVLSSYWRWSKHT